jgi:hypothetical protein
MILGGQVPFLVIVRGGLNLNFLATLDSVS